MEKKRVLGWYYIQAESIGMEIAYNPKMRIVMAEDNTVYNMNEIELLHNLNLTMPLEVHLVKGLFRGEIISVD